MIPRLGARVGWPALNERMNDEHGEAGERRKDLHSHDFVKNNEEMMMTRISF